MERPRKKWQWVSLVPTGNAFERYTESLKAFVIKLFLLVLVDDVAKKFLVKNDSEGNLLPQFPLYWSP